MPNSAGQVTSFRDLDLPNSLLTALAEVGYEHASPIQAQAIPFLMRGDDILGHAPTGTGKTAAFALPLLAAIDVHNRNVQVLTLTPTRELAIQVAEAFQRYAAHIKNFHVLPIYGGQEYGGQIRALKRGVQVVVGTPGRVMDHMRKGTLKLQGLQALVLDEADEMLRMGFVDEVEWILEQTPPKRQMALFSATMPKQIERIANRHLQNPQKVSIKASTATAETIRQRYWLVSGLHKLDALTRILEVESHDAILMFVRTRTATSELAERLEARGYAAAAMNGDMPQKQREQMVERLKKGSLDILVATDVAARGLDVDRISLVVNYDIPYDTEAYIHRIGRTGRAGRQGDAILFVAPRERRMLSAIERATRKKIEQLELPSTEVVNNQRIAKFKQKITDTLAAGELDFMQSIIEQYQTEHDVPGTQIAAALAHISLGDQQLLLKKESGKVRSSHRDDTSDHKDGKQARRERGSKGERNSKGERGSKDERNREGERNKKDSFRSKSREPNMELFRLEVGQEHGVEPANIVGAIANEAGLDAEHIGLIDIHPSHSTVELPQGMPKDIFRDLQQVWVCGRQLRISRDGEPKVAGGKKGPGKGKADKSDKSGKNNTSGKKNASDKKNSSSKTREPKKRKIKGKKNKTASEDGSK